MLTWFLVSSAIFLLFGFWVFRVVVRTDYLENFRLSPKSYLLELSVFAIHANLPYLFLPVKWNEIPELPMNQVLVFCSAVLLGVGLIILIAAWFGLGTGTSFGQDRNKLKTSGIYRYSRNPQLLGYGFVLFGITLLWSSWPLWGWLGLYLVVSFFMIQSEEEFLNVRYGESYQQYCQKVPRIFWVV